MAGTAARAVVDAAVGPILRVQALRLVGLLRRHGFKDIDDLLSKKGGPPEVQEARRQASHPAVRGHLEW
jgi:hypothetical protein